MSGEGERSGEVDRDLPNVRRGLECIPTAKGSYCRVLTSPNTRAQETVRFSLILRNKTGGVLKRLEVGAWISDGLAVVHRTGYACTSRQAGVSSCDRGVLAGWDAVGQLQ